jgi:hypothetical protein
MAPPFVRATEGNSTTDTLTLNIQVSAGSNRVLVVGLAYKSNGVLTPTSIVFNGTENFSQELIAADGGDAQCLLYYLTAPTETTADVVITMPASVRMVGYVAYFTDAHQTTPFTANTSEAQGTDVSPTVDISSSADETCIDILAQVSAGPDTATATHTQICNGAATGGGTDTRGAGQYVVGQATRTMNYGMSSDDHWNIIAGALQEPAAGGVQINATVIAGIGAVLVPTIVTAVAIAASVVIGTGLPLAPTIKTAVSYTSTVVVGTGYIPTPTIKYGISFSPTVVVGTGLPLAPIVKYGVSYPASIVIGTGLPLAPTVAAGGGQQINATIIVGTGFVPTATIKTAIVYNATIIVGTGAILSPVVKYGVVYDATIIIGDGLILSPTIKTGVVYNATVVPGIGLILSPTVQVSNSFDATVIEGIGLPLSSTIKTGISYTATIIPGLGLVLVPTIQIPSEEPQLFEIIDNTVVMAIRLFKKEPHTITDKTTFMSIKEIEG